MSIHRTAYHEAGHAVAGVVLGVPVKEAEIEPNGFVLVDPNSLMNLSAIDNIALTASGRAAEIRFAELPRDSWNGCRGDAVQIEKTLRGMNQRVADATWTAGLRKAEEIINENSWHVTNLAAMLNREGSLGGDEIRRALWTIRPGRPRQTAEEVELRQWAKRWATTSRDEKIIALAGETVFLAVNGIPFVYIDWRERAIDFGYEKNIFEPFKRDERENVGVASRCIFTYSTPAPTSSSTEPAFDFVERHALTILRVAKAIAAGRSMSSAEARKIVWG